MARMVSIDSEIPEVEHIYPLERIALISSKLQGYIVPLLNGFKEYYETLEVKPIDITTFKKNNYGKFGGSLKNRPQNGFWKRKNRFRGRDIEKFIVNAYVKQLPQNDEEKIRKIIISHLNKLNDKKFTIIVKEFIDHLEEQMFSETYEIINNEILNKVSTDNHYVYLYAKLVKELIINKKWQRKMFNIISGNEGEYFWTLNKFGDDNHDNEYVGPFETEQEALDDAMEHHNYKNSFCTFMQNRFNGRDTYIQEITINAESFDLSIFSKNKYNNFLKFIFTGVEQGIFKIDLIHHVLLNLISNRELEQFAYLYEQLHTNAKMKLNHESHNFYEGKLNEIINQVVVSPKIKFKLQEFFKLKMKNTNAFEVLAAIESSESSDNSPVFKTGDSDINCIISEYPISQDYSSSKQLFKTLKIGQYSNFTSSIISSILEVKDSEAKLLIELIEKLWDDFQEYSKSFGKFIDENLINLYGEYEIDYPNCKEIFANLIMKWLSRGLVDKEDFINNLKSKKKDDEDEQYNIDLFNEKIVDYLV